MTVHRLIKTVVPGTNIYGKPLNDFTAACSCGTAIAPSWHTHLHPGETYTYSSWDGDEAKGHFAIHRFEMDVDFRVRMTVLIDAVKAHAEAHYEEGGWDVAVECYDTAEYVERIYKCRTANGAIREIGTWVGAYDEHRRDIQATAF